MQISEIINNFKKTRQQLANDFAETNDADKYLLEHSRAADEAVREILKLKELSSRISVVAIGGFGREQLFPYSDLDLLFLLPDDVLDSELNSVGAVIGELWSLGLTVGYSVRKLDECIEQARLDITAQTAMLESRLIAGDSELFKRYTSELEKSLDFKSFYRAKFIEQEHRHLKYHESSYTLEPNIKESPGGLRDLNILIWVLRAAKFGATFDEVHRSGLITRRECDLLEMVRVNLYRLRIHMHLLTSRHEDRLVFEIQEPLAKKLGLSGVPGRRASEILMQRFYVNAKTTGQLNSIILQAVKERFVTDSGPPLDLIDGFTVRGEVLDIASDNAFEESRTRILQAFMIQERHPEIARKSSRLYRALFGAHMLMDESWSEDPKNLQAFLKIIQGRRGVWHALNEMNHWGVLGRLLPDFKKIVGQMQHDLFHAYTVDQHTLLAIRYLRNFTHSENAHELPMCTELMVSLKDNWRLVLALLYHDIGKGRGGDHSKIGAEIVRDLCRRLNLKSDDAEYIEFMVREHLTMSQVAQKQDISDPEVVEAFARKVGNLDRLVGLYLITVCDIRATSHKIWNAWKAQLLQDLFLSTAKILKGRKMTRGMLVARRRQDALALCKFSAQDTERINAFWDNFDVAYFMKHSVRNIVWHAKTLLPHLESEHSFVAARPLRGLEHAHEILVFTKDRPELFAQIVSALQRTNLSVQEARIHTGKDGRVVDSFIVTDDESDPTFGATLKEFEVKLARLIDSGEKLQPPVQGRLSRQSRQFPITPSVTLRPDASERIYLLSVVATDRLGLLASVATVFVRFKLNLLTARIATLGERVEDIFLIESPRLQDPAFCGELETAILEVLEV